MLFDNFYGNDNNARFTFWKKLTKNGGCYEKVLSLHVDAYHRFPCLLLR